MSSKLSQFMLRGGNINDEPYFITIHPTDGVTFTSGPQRHNTNMAKESSINRPDCHLIGWWALQWHCRGQWPLLSSTSPNVTFPLMQRGNSRSAIFKQSQSAGSCDRWTDDASDRQIIDHMRDKQLCEHWLTAGKHQHSASALNLLIGQWVRKGGTNLPGTIPPSPPSLCPAHNWPYDDTQTVW